MRRSYEYGLHGVQALEIIAQPETTGFITCAEEAGNHWEQRESFFVSVYEPAKQMTQLQLVALSGKSCAAAMDAITERALKPPALEEMGLKLTWGANDCAREGQPWECPVFHGEWVGYAWRRETLAIPRLSLSSTIISSPG